MDIIQQIPNNLVERYQIQNLLGEGGSSNTYEAIDLKTNQRVAIKALSLQKMNEWKVLELFEREANVLAKLNHPGIPRYLDYFYVDTPDNRCFYLVQELAEGQSLASLIQNGWHASEREVIGIARKILEILVYLHSQTPAVIHRDIKPQNIILQKDGQVFLVDFGAVQNTYHHTVTGGSTVVGTYGYMAPEQFRGKAVLSTDLYGLGTTLLFLLTQQFPADLPRQKLKINFRDRVSISTEFADWIEKIIEPAIEDRFPSAKDALAALQGEQSSGIMLERMFKRSPQSLIYLTHPKQWVFIKIDREISARNLNSFFGLINVVWKVGFCCYLIFIICYIVLIVMQELEVSLFGYIVADWLVRLFNQALFTSLAPGLLVVIFYFLMCLFWAAYTLFKKQIEIRIQDIQQVKLSKINLPLLKKSITFCLIRAKSRSYHFAFFLPQTEKEWLVGELNDFLSKLK